MVTPVRPDVASKPNEGWVRIKVRDERQLEVLTTLFKKVPEMANQFQHQPDKAHATKKIVEDAKAGCIIIENIFTGIKSNPFDKRDILLDLSANEFGIFLKAIAALETSRGWMPNIEKSYRTYASETAAKPGAEPKSNATRKLVESAIEIVAPLTPSTDPTDIALGLTYRSLL